MEFSIVIPTYNRPDDLGLCLDSIRRQTLTPSEIIIIDDGDLPADFLTSWRTKLAGQATLVYHKKDTTQERRGLAESKNKALELVANEIFLILDDDVVLESDFCEALMHVWAENINNNSLIGVGGIIKNRRRRGAGEKLFHRLFGLSSRHPWDVNQLGFQNWDEEISGPSLGYYAHGGACSYRLAPTRALKFSIFSGGRTALEDVDFCARAKQSGYHFIIEPRAVLSHYSSPVSREGLFLMGYKEGYNRRLIFLSLNKKPSPVLWARFYWANFGWVLRQFLSGHILKGVGLAKGVFASQK